MRSPLPPSFLPPSLPVLTCLPNSWLLPCLAVVVVVVVMLLLDQDLFLSFWAITPEPTLALQVYEDTGSAFTGPGLHGPLGTALLTMPGSAVAPFVTLWPVLNRTDPSTGGPVLDLLVTNGSDTIFLVTNDRQQQAGDELPPLNLDLQTGNLSAPRPWLRLNHSAAKLYLHDLDGDGRLELLVAGAYGDLPGMLTSQVMTASNVTGVLFDPQHQHGCNNITIYSSQHHAHDASSLRHPRFVANGSISVNASACVMDFSVGSWQDPGDLLVTLLPLQALYRFPARAWLGQHHLLQLEGDGEWFSDATTLTDDVISVDSTDLDGRQNSCCHPNNLGAQ